MTKRCCPQCKKSFSHVDNRQKYCSRECYLTPRKVTRALVSSNRNRVQLVWKKNGKRITKLEHRAVWESHFGKIPRGKHVHHKDGNSLNNSIENLELLDPLDHQRLHSGTYRHNEKLCTKCKEWMSFENFRPKKIKNGFSFFRQCRRCESISRKNRKIRSLCVAAQG